MATRRHRVGTLATDGRVWLLTLALLGLYATNWYNVLPRPADLVTVPALVVMFLYLYATGLGLLFKWLVGMPGFWVGYGLFTYAVAALVVWGVDRVRAGT